VKNPDSGYDAARDCTIFLASPAYSPFATIPRNWEDHLTFWQNVLSLLPDAANVQITFREGLPQEGTGERWIDAYKQRMENQKLNSKILLFYIGGADFYSNDYSWSASPISNGMFRGAESIYNFSGAVHQEPMQLLNSEFSWNAEAPGFRIPKTYEEGKRLFQALKQNEEVPAEIQGPDGLLEEACQKIYGDKAGLAMMRYSTYFTPQPYVGAGPHQSRLVPSLPGKIYPLAVLGWALERDQAYWKLQTADPKLLQELNISEAEWQDRLSQFWRLRSRVNGEAIAIVSEALFAWMESWLVGDSRLQEREDVEYLQRCLRVGRLFADFLAEYHALLAGLSRSRSGLDEKLEATRRSYRDLYDYLQSNFDFNFIDPLGGDQATWLGALSRLRSDLEELGPEVSARH
jgi:hypothetical protein